MSIRDEALKHIHKRRPEWHDNGVGIVQGSHYRSGFADGAEWAASRPAPVIQFDDEQAVLDHFAEGAAWLSVVSADSWPYILTTTEDGDVFVQGFPSESEEGADIRIDHGSKWLSDMPEAWFPVTISASDVEIERHDA